MMEAVCGLSEVGESANGMVNKEPDNESRRDSIARDVISAEEVEYSQVQYLRPDCTTEGGG